jgi:hypothetical protein
MASQMSLLHPAGERSSSDLYREHVHLHTRISVTRERDKRLTAAHDDPEFGEVVTQQERNPATN